MLNHIFSLQANNVVINTKSQQKGDFITKVGAHDNDIRGEDITYSLDDLSVTSPLFEIDLNSGKVVLKQDYLDVKQLHKSVMIINKYSFKHKVRN